MTRAVGLSDKGRVRKGNEDAFVCADDLGLFAVADGMGGHKPAKWRRAWPSKPSRIHSPFAAETRVLMAVRPRRQSVLEGNRLRTAIHLANRRIFRTAESNDDYCGMGTTIVRLLITGPRVAIGHVGDSRLYVRQRRAVEQVTQDDSWAATILAQDPRDKPADLVHHPMRNVLTNVLGAREQTDIHLAEVALTGDEVLLLCSDGLHSALSDEDIARVLDGGEGLEAAAKTLVDAALEAGSRDNVTVLLATCSGVPA